MWSSRVSFNACAPCLFDLSNRRWEVRVVCACLGVALVIPWFYFLPSVIVCVSLSCSLAAVVYLGFRLSRWFGRDRIGRIACTTEGAWVLATHHGSCTETQLSSATRIYRHWHWLVFASGHTILVGPGDLAADQQRRLRIMLRRYTTAAPIMNETVA